MPNLEETPHIYEDMSETEATQTEYFDNLKTRHIGARALASESFESRHRGITESSFQKLQSSDDKITIPEGERPLSNRERRDYAYLTRIEELINSHGTKAEQQLWDMSAKRLIIKDEDVPESYWTAQEQILRDNGQGYELSKREKDILLKDAQEKQRASLETWASYLGDENSPYPIWFKIFAWEGMSRLGVFDKDKEQYTKRNKSTMAPFPTVNPAALAKTYGVVANFYGIHSEDCYNEEAAPEDLARLVQSGNFNKIYSKMLLESKVILKTPERTEDAHGEWIEYLPGDEKKLSLAAEGTPWCIADPNVGRNYLEKGAYGYNSSGSSNGAKFILFHLEDPNTGRLADNACASIRLDANGNVAEVSGLNKGQAIEDSLVPIVEEKVKTLPGGKKFFKAFADKKELIRLDRKWQAGENFTPEEWNFVFGKKRKIVTLDSYNGIDPRLKEFRSLKALEHGANIDDIIPYLEEHFIADHLDAILGYGANIDNLVQHLEGSFIVDNLDNLVNRGATIEINDLVSRLEGHVVLEKLDTLLKRGATIDMNELASRLHAQTIAFNLDTLVSHGATIDMDKLVSRLRAPSIVYALEPLLRYGAPVDKVVKRLNPRVINKNIVLLRKYGYQG